LICLINESISRTERLAECRFTLGVERTILLLRAARPALGLDYDAAVAGEERDDGEARGAAMSPGGDGGAWRWSSRWHRCRVRDEGYQDVTAAMVEGGGAARRWGLRLIC
jgi:hypothetical protein